MMYANVHMMREMVMYRGGSHLGGNRFSAISRRFRIGRSLIGLIRRGFGR